MIKIMPNLLKELFDKPKENPEIFINKEIKKLMDKPNEEVSQIIQAVMGKENITFGETIILKRLLDLIDNSTKPNKNKK